MKRTVLLAIVSMGALSCKPSKEQVSYEIPLEPSKIEAKMDTLEVETQIAELRAFTYPVQASGKIKAAYEELMLAQNGGLLQFCKARNGLRVSVGEIIASFETSDLELRKERLLVQKFNAQKEYESQLLGYEALLKEKTNQEAEAVRQKLKASTGLLALDIDLKELEHDLARTNLKAPITGVLAQVQIQKGMHIRPGQELYRIYSADQLFVEAKVLESDLPLLKTGQQALVKSVANPEVVYAANLAEIDPMVDEHGLLNVRLKILHPRNLLLGMNANAEIKVPQKRGIVVPRNAIVLRNNRPVIFTWENGLSKWNYVTTGTENGESIEILEGIKAGSEIIVSNNIQLAHNGPVKNTKQ
ncbi:efflux RND transporter periplasmic adaptor subunit [Haliscomenobacter hydrossis]|uniref:Efflux transporter, RND family, MFP subunit n=1 Tax=Haliscomenobacter hydrossis (strain ATCC 27775 / DSM 1100 / LMG 10767 / O) TaxID=760192 RepID=F4L342_HALH1|nr:efflux RND transporter periplasmic adaptor subunit [Haliscomenobacter hydrossis]AEE50701.1 efflux transporter, RND family, MFP subunit [Haliscomenobacter hydrossis DSM 1100]